MRQVHVLLSARLACRATSLVSTRGVLTLHRWDGGEAVPDFAGAAWALVPSGKAEQAIGVLRNDSRTAKAHVTLVTEANDNAVAAQDCGADDVLSGPLDVAALTRHFERICERLPTFREGVIQAGPLSLDLAAYLACWNGRPIRLALTEFRLLTFFVNNPGRLVARTELVEMLGRAGDTVSDAVVTGWVGRMNRKLRAAGVPDVLQGLRGHGYRFLPPAA